MQQNRNTQRKLVGLLVKLAHKGLDEFAAKYATNLSDGGMFIRTREPKPIGTELSFKVEIADGQRVLQGTAIVRWTRGENDPAGPAGMGLEFLTLDPASRALVDRMLGKSAPTAPPPPPAPPPAIAPLVAPAAVDEDEPFSFATSLASRPVPAVAPAVPPRAPAPPGIAPVVPPLASVAQPVARPVVPPPAPPVAPSPVEPAADDGFELPIDDGDLFAGSADVDPSRAVDLDLDELLGATPAAPREVELELDAPASSDSGVAIDLEPLEQADPLPSSAGVALDLDALLGEPPNAGIDIELEATPAEPALPTIRRGPPAPPPPPPAAPVVLDAKKAEPPPPAPATQGPVYLKDVKAAEATGAVIGIDLGTTNSAVAVLTKGRPIILTSKDGYNTIPSVVALTAQNRLLIGHRAKSQLVLNPTQSIFGAKRLVGREYDSPTVKEVRDRSHFEIVQGGDRRAAVKLGDKVLSLEEVQALVLKECREMAEQSLGQPVGRAVITCPAYYSEPQREAVRRAGAMAGLKVERVLNEPTAAALAFGMNRELKKTVLVYDLGGGTFDATLLKIDQNVFEVLATGGDVFLGGTDFDNQLVDLLLRRFQEQHKRPFSGDRVALSRVTEVAEKAKVALSEQKTFDVHLPMLEMDGQGKPLDLRTTISRADLEEACRELVDRTIHAVHDVLLDAKLKPAQVDDIILVGGMSRMPMVREKLKEVFKKPAHASVNADEAVALGAALYSGTVDKVSSLVLIDVVPMTIGLGRPGGQFHRLIERNTPLPATKSFGLSTQKDDETELEVMVFQGEDSNVAGNEFLGAVTISGLPKGPKGSVQVAITLGLDAECVLRVEAREFKTRQVVRATLATRYTTEEIAQRLGISAEKRAAVNKSRNEELEKRAGGFWSKLKGLFKR
ncbi:MAG: TIGR02266 family protein [Myxococcota bacterium]